ncbi:unnamed protein product [Protopolystoma xenopodis]|uniref:Uncharacterized protein n=1 Tax=Protopolystoma xenopodis TaxID=117903 RepID=A0A448WLL9_9PLAT|nr:unnamed protein product [Protopolystoma xenopodis]
MRVHLSAERLYQLVTAHLPTPLELYSPFAWLFSLDQPTISCFAGSRELDGLFYDLLLGHLYTWPDEIPASHTELFEFSLPETLKMIQLANFQSIFRVLEPIASSHPSFISGSFHSGANLFINFLDRVISGQLNLLASTRLIRLLWRLLPSLDNCPPINYSSIGIKHIDLLIRILVRRLSVPHVKIYGLMDGLFSQISKQLLADLSAIEASDHEASYYSHLLSRMVERICVLGPGLPIPGLTNLVDALFALVIEPVISHVIELFPSYRTSYSLIHKNKLHLRSTKPLDKPYCSIQRVSSAHLPPIIRPATWDMILQLIASPCLQLIPFASRSGLWCNRLFDLLPSSFLPPTTNATAPATNALAPVDLCLFYHLPFLTNQLAQQVEMLPTHGIEAICLLASKLLNLLMASDWADASPTILPDSLLSPLELELPTPYSRLISPVSATSCRLDGLIDLFFLSIIHLLSSRESKRDLDRENLEVHTQYLLFYLYWNVFYLPINYLIDV